MPPFHVRSLRGEIEETRHRVHAVVLDADGTVRAAVGDPDLLTPTRSAAKPFQAVPLVSSGAVDRFDITPAELALVCASHNSERRQVEAVAALLERTGGRPSELVCQPHRPLYKDLGYPDATAEVDPVELASPSPLSSNCSGKHTGMLALARHHDWPVAGYERSTHDVQRAGREAFGAMCGAAPERIAWSTDGCGVPSWAVTVRELARGFARLGTDDGAASVVRTAMMDHPEMVAGERRLCTALMRAYPGRVVAKVGAGGVYGAAVLDAGVGIAIKIEDGNGYAAGTALLAVLADLELLDGVRDRLRPYGEPAIFNTLRAVVGRYEPVGRVA